MNVLIQNFHPNNTIALIKDFKAIGYTVFMPDSNWNDRIRYYFDNSGFGCELISYNEWMALPPGDIIIGCYELERDLKIVARMHKDRCILHVSSNNTPYEHGIDYLLSPDIQTFNNYPAKNKMLYFYTPITFNLKKDLKKSFNNKIISSYIHFYSKYWTESYKLASEFKSKYSGNVNFFGAENINGQLAEKDAQENMVKNIFTLYFKEKDCYGNTVLESMALGTPVIAYKPFIIDKTLGMFFLNNTNSIIVDSVDEAIERLKSLTLDEYTKLSINAIITVNTLTETTQRLNKLKETLNG